MALRVLHIVRQLSPSVGGLEDSVLSIARVERDRFGIDARIVTLDRVFGRPERLAASDAVDGVPVTRLPWTGSTRYPLAPSVLRHLAGADLLHVHAIDFFFDFLALTRPLHRKPMIASTHGGFFHSAALARAKRFWFATVTRASIRAYGRIAACSHGDAEMFRNVAGRRLSIVENGINLGKFASAGSPRPTRTIVSFGRFARHKQPDLLFPLLSRLRADHPDWRLILAGRDADLTRRELQASAEAAGVAEAVRFVISPSDDELRAVLGEASYFGCLSSHEGFGLAAVEAMSAGLVPVLSDIPPFRRFNSETSAGLIVDPADPDAAAAALVRLHREQEGAYDAERTRVMLAAQRYDWRRAAARYVEIYDEVLACRRPLRAAAASVPG